MRSREPQANVNPKDRVLSILPTQVQADENRPRAPPINLSLELLRRARRAEKA